LRLILVFHSLTTSLLDSSQSVQSIARVLSRNIDVELGVQSIIDFHTTVSRSIDVHKADQKQKLGLVNLMSIVPALHRTDIDGNNMPPISAGSSKGQERKLVVVGSGGEFHSRTRLSFAPVAGRNIRGDTD
jgi:hypothetical protein